MVRKIDELSARNLYARNTWSMSNTATRDGVLYLHGNQIARLDESGRLFVTLAGWNTTTTRARLNALDGVNIRVRAGRPYLNGVEISESGWYLVEG